MITTADAVSARVSRPVAGAAVGMLASVLIVAIGCAQVSTERYTLNPDGSGKVEVRMARDLEGGAQMDPFGGMGTDGSTDQRARQEVLKIVRDSEGVDAWTDVSHRVEPVEDKNYLVFEGTAYFPDLNELELTTGNAAPVKLDWQRHDDGSATLTIGMDTNDEADQREDADEQPDAEEIDDPLIKRLQEAESRQGLRMMQTMVEGFRREMVFNLPAEVAEASGMESHSEREVRFVFDGREIAEAFEELLDKDVEDWAEAFDDLTVQQLRSMDEDVVNRIVGARISARAVIRPDGESLFDYQAEVAEAKQAQRRIERKLEGGDEQEDF